jgi:hypothetical protein
MNGDKRYDWPAFIMPSSMARDATDAAQDRLFRWRATEQAKIENASQRPSNGNRDAIVFLVRRGQLDTQQEAAADRYHEAFISRWMQRGQLDFRPGGDVASALDAQIDAGRRLSRWAEICESDLEADALHKLAGLRLMPSKAFGKAYRPAVQALSAVLSRGVRMGA